MSGFIDAFEKAAGARIKQEIETHFRDEYSMFSWILEGMLQRAGFDILERRSSQGGMLIEYFCRKNRDVMISSNSG
jgi:hypothetical protein